MIANWIDNLNDTGRKVLFAVVVVVLVLVALWATGDKNDPTAATEPEGTAGDGTSVVVPDATTETPAQGDAPQGGSNGLAVVASSPVPEDTLATLAQRAATFVATYQSFKYSDDPATKVSAIRRQLSRNSLVAPELAVPSDTALAAMRTEQTTVVVDPTRARVTLVAPSTVAVLVDANATTTRGGVADTQKRTYSVTLYDDGGWGVGDFSFDGDTAE